jgi:phosphoglycerate dehydrogenase-like enzyme
MSGGTAITRSGPSATADVVSVHLQLGPHTTGLVGAEEIAAMKPGAILVNTSRGPIIDEGALLAALSAGRIRAGLDVYDVEPLPADHPLRRAPNLVMTPHLGFVTEGAYRAWYPDLIAGIRAWQEGRPVRVLAAPTD